MKKVWRPTTISFWLAVLGSFFLSIPTPPTRWLGRTLFLILAFGGAGAVYGHVAGINGLHIEPTPVLPYFQKSDWQALIVHAAWVVPAWFSAWRDQ